MTLNVLSEFGLAADECTIQPFGNGLINKTWKISFEDKAYILQLINQDVFKQPADISENINALADYLGLHFPEYLFIRPLTTPAGKSVVHIKEQGYFRMSPFVPFSFSYDVVKKSNLAYEAAMQFGKFTKLLSSFPAERLHITLPDFHNLSLRYRQFETALIHGDPVRIEEAHNQIKVIRQFRYIVDEYERIRFDPGFKRRVTHHDTKIGNVLFDKKGRGICVIDLDTVMHGYFISDFGDMMRTYLSPVSEEEKDFTLITVREDYFEAIVKGYLVQMKDELTAAEMATVVYSGKFMIYMQALRFLTDHLTGDLYYGAKYEGHNLVRAGNQVALLQRLDEKENVLNGIVASYANA